jgi:hypothetical protein
VLPGLDSNREALLRNINDWYAEMEKATLN